MHPMLQTTAFPRSDPRNLMSTQRQTLESCHFLTSCVNDRRAGVALESFLTSDLVPRKACFGPCPSSTILPVLPKRDPKVVEVLHMQKPCKNQGSESLTFS